MRSRSILFVLLLLIGILLLLRPKLVWAEFMRIHRQWDVILRLIVIVIFVYLVFGLFTIWSGDLTWWPFG